MERERGCSDKIINGAVSEITLRIREMLKEGKKRQIQPNDDDEEKDWSEAS